MCVDRCYCAARLLDPQVEDSLFAKYFLRITLASFMEVLKELHTSVTKTLGHHFDNAYRDLYQELALRDARVQAAKEATEVAEGARQKIIEEVVTLKKEVTLLREEMRLSDIGSNEDGLIREKCLELEAAYAPHRIQELTNVNAMEALESTCGAETIFQKYAALYHETQTLMKASDELKKQVKRHKKKLTYWRKSLDRDKFTLVLDGVEVHFQRLKKATDDDQMPSTPMMPVTFTESSGPVARIAVNEALTPVLNSPYSDTCNDVSNDGAQIIKPNGCNDLLQKPQLKPTSMQPVDTYANKEAVITRQASNPLSEAAKRKYIALEESAQGSLVLRDNFPSDNAVRSSQSLLIKDLNTPSDPLQPSSPNCNVVGTQDLDEVGDAVETPRKKKKHNHSQHLREASTALEGRRVGSEDSLYCSPASTHSALKRSTVLQSADCSLKINGPTQWPGGKLARSTRNPPQKAISSITEDGDQNYSAVSGRQKFNTLASKSGSRPSGLNNTDRSTDQRLQCLLEGPLPAKQNLQPKPVTREVPRTLKERDSLWTCDGDVTAHSTATVFSSSCDTKVTGEGSLTEPFRAQPLHRLELNHFKLNPNYNQGVDYAFSSVVRKRDERKCANGCTRLSCCGNKFHAMARLGDLSANVTSTREKENEDQRVLEDYLADGKHALDWLSSEDRERLLQEAKAKLIADRYGKHRHHHQRLGSPPGYWRTDMPDTQELQRDHKEARELERERVTDRYREAMRPGGLWKFADE
ncbi:SAE2-domain-containing protein [Aspergillus heteromorphus CBS 117.55]|uniref:SAE2-domain-containing protein n=1 Tax=Aspergillus heteromorphus CBS 117.55 TaxID=1448321 RepID=A0A317UUR6_9EURO|nr:SAE2-domain-containing protein [Aspergillus heteromorphus CBS 117.55]PWY65345.1 SAE2-domain-containing protein [Aspergillus heteromorphus CBS 117.55]